MQPTLFGLDGIPAGDPGFTVAIEIDRPLTSLAPGRRTTLLDDVSQCPAHLDRSPLGNARIVFEVAHSGWWKSGQIAVDAAEKLKDAWPIVGIEICRSDLWATEPFFDHEPDGLGDLPEWCHHEEPGRQSTVIVEVEPERTPSGKRRTVRPLLNCYHQKHDARLSRSTAERPQLIVEMLRDAVFGARLIAKPAHFISSEWSITRIRSIRSDVYRSESGASNISGATDSAQIPEWQLVSNSDMDRYVVVTDPHVDMNGWSAEITTVDGHTSMRPFFLDSVWVVEDGTANIVGDGSEVPAWTARIENASHLVALHNADTRLEIDPWDSMAAWLVESMHGKPVGLVIELGPSDYGPAEEEDGVPVVCAQIQVLDDGVYMVRRSREVLGYLMLADYSADGLELDTWHHDDHFDDCTDGYLFTRDTRLIANTCITWFRDNTGMTKPDDLGCNYRFADELPRSL